MVMKHFIVCVLCGLTVLIMSAFGALEFNAANFGPGGPGVYQCTTGSIQFKSEAPLELIEARSTQLLGAINPANQTFAWSVDVLSFSGFNSTLQREHFNENYLESTRYPKATFAGKIIEKIDFDKDGVYSVRAKGKLNVHGVEQERIIKGQLERKGRKLHISASFSVPLTDHNITVPKIVYQKIAQEILITVDADLILKP